MMLRLCNDLLRRLAKVNDAVLCGRVLIMLASFLPLSERSGVNLHGAYNVHNVTEYDGEDEERTGEPSSSEPPRTHPGPIASPPPQNIGLDLLLDLELELGLGGKIVPEVLLLGGRSTADGAGPARGGDERVVRKLCL